MPFDFKLTSFHTYCGKNIWCPRPFNSLLTLPDWFKDCWLKEQAQRGWKDVLKSFLCQFFQSGLAIRNDSPAPNFKNIFSYFVIQLNKLNIKNHYSSHLNSSHMMSGKLTSDGQSFLGIGVWMWSLVIFIFEFRVFLLLDKLSYQG